MQDQSRHDHRVYYCKRCLGHFSTAAIRDVHVPHCRRSDFDNIVVYMPKAGTMLKFENKEWKALVYAPFVVYADFESLTIPIDRVRQCPHSSYNLLVFLFNLAQLTHFLTPCL